MRLDDYICMSLTIHPEGASTNRRTLKDGLLKGPRAHIGASLTDSGSLKDPVRLIERGQDRHQS